MPDMPYEQPAELLRAIDVLARAVFTWVRHESLGQRFRGNPLSTEEQSVLAAGFIAGLRTRIGFSDAEGALVAYAYALMSGERNGALAMIDKLLLQDSGLQFSCSGYLHGLRAARTLLCDFKFVCADSAGDPLPDGSAPFFRWAVLN